LNYLASSATRAYDNRGSNEERGIMKKILGVLTLMLFASCGAAFCADKASIVYVDGEVTMNDSPASVGDVVLPGATIKTQPDAVCQIVFNTKNIIHMTGGTILTFDPNVLSKGATLKKGAIAMVLRNLGPFVANPGELRFSIRTSNTVAGVRGTCFFVKVEDDNNTFVCCCNGTLHLEGTSGEFTQNIAGSHHREVRVTSSGGGVSLTAAPLLYHTDADVEAIAARIGETIDWTKIDQSLN
jgi:hypothetical protein